MKYPENRKILCEYIKSIENEEEFDMLSKIHIDNQPLFFNYLGELGLSIKKLKDLRQ